MLTNSQTKRNSSHEPNNLSSHSGSKRRKYMDFYKAVYIYMLGGLVGTIWETLLNFARGRGFVYCNGSILTPFNFVYGVGALVIILCLGTQTKAWQVYLIGAAGGGAVEYLLSFLEEKILGTRSWNYSNKLLNINGRTTIIYMAFWGLLCLGVIFVIYNPLISWLNSLPPKPMQLIAIVMAVIIALDFIITMSALIRYTGRFADKQAITAVGSLIDKIFSDTFMQKRFPAMKF